MAGEGRAGGRDKDYHLHSVLSNTMILYFSQSGCKIHYHNLLEEAALPNSAHSVQDQELPLGIQTCSCLGLSALVLDNSLSQKHQF